MSIRKAVLEADPNESWVEVAKRLDIRDTQLLRNRASQLRKQGFNIPKRPVGHFFSLSREMIYDDILYCLSTAGRPMSSREIASFWGERIENASQRYDDLTDTASIAHYATELMKLGKIRKAYARARGSSSWEKDVCVWMPEDRKYFEYDTNKYDRVTLHFTD